MRTWVEMIDELKRLADELDKKMCEEMLTRNKAKIILCKRCKKAQRIDNEWVCMMRGEVTEEDGYCHKGETESE